jgi:hypothetical protein
MRDSSRLRQRHSRISALGVRSLLPLREKVAGEAGRMRGPARSAAMACVKARRVWRRLSTGFGANPSSVAFGDTFSRKGRRDSLRPV